MTQLPPGFSFVRNFQNIQHYSLDNGLEVLLFEDQSQANVTVNLTYLVGSRHEGRGEAGMAHLLEHMLFRGTKELRDVKGALQDRGAQFNATTWYDRTNYFETLTPTRENLQFALKLEADRMINSLILQEDLDAEMTVVRNEFEMGENNPVHVLHDQMMSSAYLWHNYGKTTIGNRSDIERVPALTLRKFYEFYYQPDNAVLLVAGQFKADEAISLINTYFASIPRPHRLLDQTYTEEPAQEGPREVVLERAGDKSCVAAAYHIPAAAHEDSAALKVFVDIITDEPGGHLYKELIESGHCSELFSMVYSLCDPGMALIFSRPTDDHQALKLRDVLLNLIEKTAIESIDEQQVKRIKARQLKRFKLAMSNSKDMALKLSEAIACGDWRLFFWHKDQINRVSLADVKRVAAKYFLRSNRTSGVFIPSDQSHRVLINHVKSIEQVVGQLAEDHSLVAGEAFEASIKNIEGLVRRLAKPLDYKIAYLPKKTRGQSVRAQAIFRYGYDQALRPWQEELCMLPTMLWRGTSKLDYQAVRDKLDALMSTLDLSGHAGMMTASIKSECQYIDQSLELLADLVKKPAFKPEEFLIVKQREIDDYEEIKSDPQRLGFHELERLKSPWPKETMLYVPSFDERIEALKVLSVDKIEDAYKQVFSWQNLSIAMVGDADGEKLWRVLPELFAGQAKVDYQRVKRPHIKNTVGNFVFHTPDKEMAIIAMAYNFPMRDDHADYAALKIANYMFGENMNSRLMSRIREKEGISYGAGSWLEVGRHDECASLNIYAMAAPASVKRAQRAITEEWLRFVEQGVEEQELNHARASMWLSFSNNLANDGYLVNTLAADLEIARNFNWREHLFASINQLSLFDIKNAVQKWWQSAQFSVVTAGDKNKLS